MNFSTHGNVLLKKTQTEVYAVSTMLNYLHYTAMQNRKKNYGTAPYDTACQSKWSHFNKQARNHGFQREEHLLI